MGVAALRDYRDLHGSHTMANGKTEGGYIQLYNFMKFLKVHTIDLRTTMQQGVWCLTQSFQ